MSSPLPTPRRWSRALRLQLWVGSALLVLLLVPSVCEKVADHHAAYGIRVDRMLEAPSRGEWFGTDALGRSQWQRTLVAMAVSTATAGGAVALALPLGLILGALAGAFADRWPDRLVSWVVALLHTVPFFLLIVAVAALAGPVHLFFRGSSAASSGRRRPASCAARRSACCEAVSCAPAVPTAPPDCRFSAAASSR